MGCVQAVVEKKKLVVQLKKIAEEISDFFFDCVCIFKRGDMP